MAEFTKQETKKLSELLTAADYRELSEMTYAQKLKNGIGGYSPAQIRNFVVWGHKCNPAIKTLILDYVKEKA